MSSAQSLYETLAAAITSQPDVAHGRMMSAPAITWKKKVFAFYYVSTGNMVFRLGKEFDPASLGIKTARPLSPFKSKPPMMDWLEIDASESNLWEKLAGMALDRMRG